MTRKKTYKYEKYWNFPGSIWKTESAWFSWIRSSIRKSWNRHPCKIAKLNAERIKIPNPNPKGATRFPEVWGGKCSCCGGVYPLSASKKEGRSKVVIQVDHILESGSLTDVSHLQRFVERLFVVSPDDLQLICSVCNKVKDYAARNNMTFEEAKLEKGAKAIVDAKEDKQFLLDRDILPASAQANRRRQVFEQLKKEAGL